jgi:UDP-glucose 4-epimerase
MNQNILVTGGAGFIGSHLVKRLIQLNSHVVILDNLSSGSKDNLRFHFDKNVKFIRGDCTNSLDVKKALKNIDIIFHLAANSEIALSQNESMTVFNDNIYSTHIILEEMKRTAANTIVFTSTSSVYGDASIMPTPEEHVTRPISIYGACKLASEVLVTSYAQTYDRKAIILRLANVVGAKSRHGVIIDFFNKLRTDPKKLEILGDGRQAKSYIYIHDCINAMLVALQRAEGSINILNIGSKDKITVSRIAEILVNEMNLSNVFFQFMRGTDDGRGWKGDVKNMLLDIRKITSLSWKPQFSSEEAIRKTIKELLKLTSMRHKSRKKRQII